MQFVSLGDALDGDDIGADSLPRQHGAGFDRLAIDMHNTGAALAGVTPNMRPGQVQMIEQKINKKGPVLYVGRDRLAIYRQFDCRHARYLPMLFYFFQLEAPWRDFATTNF